jgi:hypothetical protein
MVKMNIFFFESESVIFNDKTDILLDFSKMILCVSYGIKSVN